MRQSANTLPLGQVGKRTTIYWAKRKGEGQVTGVLTQVERSVDETITRYGGDVLKYLTATTVTVDGVKVPCDEWEVAE